MTDEQPSEKKRSKRGLLVFGIAFVTIAVAILLASSLMRPTPEKVIQLVINDALDARKAVDRLGGPEDAALSLSTYAAKPGLGETELATATRLLGLCGEQAVASLIQLAAHDNAQVRAKAAEALGVASRGESEALDCLVRLLADSVEDVRFETCHAIKSIGPPAKSVLVHLIRASKKDEAVYVRAAAFEAITGVLALTREWPSDVLDEVIGGVSDSSDLVASLAVVALRSSGSRKKQVIAALVQSLSHSGRGTRIRAAVALLKLGRARHVDVNTLNGAVVLKSVRSQIPWISKVKPLKISGERPSNALVQAAKASDCEVRLAVAFQVGATEAPLADKQKVLSVLASDEFPDIRWATAISIGELGVNGGPLAESLRKLTADADPQVRQAAAEALKKIRAKEKPQP